jgi:hypothetical protein
MYFESIKVFTLKSKEQTILVFKIDYLKGMLYDK